MVRNLVLLLSLTFASLLNAYSQAEGENDFSKYVRSGGSGVVEFNPENNTVKGTPFLFDSWLPGTVTMLDGTIHRNLQLKHDIANNWVVAKGNTDVDIILEAKVVVSFSLKNDGLTSTFINLDNIDSINIKGVSGFIELLYLGKKKVFVKNEKFVKNMEPSGAYGASATYDQYTLRNPSYYYVDENNNVSEFRLSKKGVNGLFNKTGEYSSYIKKSKINLKTEEGLIELVSYIDNL